jgi:hypothetical protein
MTLHPLFLHKGNKPFEVSFWHHLACNSFDSSIDGGLPDQIMKCMRDHTSIHVNIYQVLIVKISQKLNQRSIPEGISINATLFEM